MRAAGRRTTERVGADLRERVRRHTPVAKPPPGAAGEWEASRGGRPPGTLRESWRVGKVTVRGSGGLMSIDVYTEDPVAPDVEWDTQPHIIRPRGEGGMLRFWTRSGDVVFATIVHHPGTRGVHMLATALVEVAASWQEIGREEMERWAREQLRGVG
jgi:hypothetical protein